MVQVDLESGRVETPSFSLHHPTTLRVCSASARIRTTISPYPQGRDLSTSLLVVYKRTLTHSLPPPPPWPGHSFPACSQCEVYRCTLTTYTLAAVQRFTRAGCERLGKEGLGHAVLLCTT